MNAQPKLEILNNKDLGRFEARIGDALAVAEYHSKADVSIFTHTEVPASLEG